MIISLVTGGAGFIGAHVARELLKLGHKIVVLDDLSGGFEENLPQHPNATLVRGSILDHELLARLFQAHKFNYVYHLAAYAAEGLSHFIRRFNYQNNLVGSVNLINESIKHQIECFVFTSSIATYGALPPPMREDMTPRPEDPYGVAKYAVELDLKCAHEMFGLDYVIFRPHNVYGEYQNLGDRYRNVVGIFLNQLMQGKPLTVFGDGEQKRAFSYVGDIAPHMANCVNVPAAYGEVINIGADQEYTVNELATTLMKSMGLESMVRHVEARNEVQIAWSDHAKAHRLFGQARATTLREGLDRMVDWARRVGIQKSNRFENIEVLEKLPPVWLEE